MREAPRWSRLWGMKSPPSPEAREAEKKAGWSELQRRLEQARLEMRALYRALDRLRVAQEVPPALRRLGELDADFAEALWVLKQPRGRFNLAAMRRDTEKSLEEKEGARQEFLKLLPEETRQRVERLAAQLRGEMGAEEAYQDIPE